MDQDTRKFYHAVCEKKGHHFLIGTDGDLVTDFVDMTDNEAAELKLPSWKSLHVANTLRHCPWCGTDQVGSCRCQMEHDCPDPGDYRYPCLFCQELRPAGGVPNGAKDLASMRLSVTSPHFDDIGTVLNSMKLSFEPYDKAGFDCDILFLNCGSADQVPADRLRSFVENGGCVYASDWAADVLVRAFPGCGMFDKNGLSGKYKAEIKDEEIRSVVGRLIDINFDLGAWVHISNPQGTVLMTTAQYPTRPLMFTFTHGEGRVFYTSFHNHAQASDAERALLQVMLARQIGSVTSMSTDEVLKILGLRINVIH